MARSRSVRRRSRRYAGHTVLGSVSYAACEINNGGYVDVNIHGKPVYCYTQNMTCKPRKENPLANVCQPY